MVQKEDIENLFEYRDGQLIWRYNPNSTKTWNTRFAGKPAGSIRKDRYVAVQFKLGQRRYVTKLHRLVWLLFTGSLPSKDLDHIDRNPLNNKIENLRDVSHQVNSFNRGPNKNTTSGVKGVSWNKKNKVWTAHIFFSGKKIHLGSFKEIDQAVKARLDKEEELGINI